MKVLLDEDLPHDLRLKLPSHDVRTVRYMGWHKLKNGNLIKLAEDSGFQVLVTGDQNLSYQQNLKGRAISLLCFLVRTYPHWKELFLKLTLPSNVQRPVRFSSSPAAKDIQPDASPLYVAFVRHFVSAAAKCLDNP